MNWDGLARRLEAKYGLGEIPFASRKVYNHVERLCHVHGDRVYQIVWDMAAYADTRDNPGRNFRKYVLIRLAEHGFDTSAKPAGGGAEPEAQARPQKAAHDAAQAIVRQAATKLVPPAEASAERAPSDAERRRLFEEAARRHRGKGRSDVGF
jgi:hypothetical protein